MRSIEFRLLGPLEVEHDGRPVVLGGAKERALLALLLLHANEFVSHDRLIEELWGGSPPQSARHALQAYVSRLRKTLGAGSTEEIIETRPGGYLLRIDPEQLDLRRFERLAAEGRGALAAGEADRAAETMREALALWHGSPLDDLAFEPFAPAEIQRLEELRLGAVETRMEAELQLGHAAEVIPELELLVARHSLNERLRGQLMLALYRTGRQTEALDLYREGRSNLVEELGIEPGEELRQLQQAMLRQDPTLAPVTDRSAARASAVRRPTVPSRRKWFVLAALLAVVAAAVAVPVLALGGDSSYHRLTGNGLVLLDPGTGRASGVVALRARPGAAAARREMLWVAQPDAGTVQRIDVRRGSIVQTVKIGHASDGVALGSGGLWVVSTLPGAIVRIDSVTGRITNVIQVGNTPTAVAYGSGSIWVANHHDRTVSRIDAQRRRVTATIRVDAAIGGLAAGGGSVWVTDEATGRLIRIDPGTNTVAGATRVGRGPTAVAAARGSVWVANSLAGTVSEIDPISGKLRRTIAVGEAPAAVLVAEDAIWVANELGGSVSRITPSTGAQATTAVDGRPASLTWVDGHVVVAVAAP